MSSDSSAPGQCPVVFCGAPTLSVGFDTFLSNAQKIDSMGTQHLFVMSQVVEKTKDLDHGVLVVLLPNKNELIQVLGILASLKKRIDRGVIRVIVYDLMNNDKAIAVLKQKGAAETLVEGLTQKALVHKLQRHIQIVLAKRKTAKDAKADEVTTFKGSANGGAQASDPERVKLAFVPAVENENDCWLLKNKKDFKFVRGMWLGEMIGPGPSAGSWAELSAGAKGRSGTYLWTPKGSGSVDPFVPGKGGWYFTGRQPEFVWKSNRWRFLGESPSLCFKPLDGGSTVFRFRAPAPGSLEVALNSAVAKGKLQSIIQTFQADKRFREEERKQSGTEDLLLSPAERAARGQDGGLPPEDADLADWGDGDASEDENGPDWGGLDTGRGNKFNSGRGLGQGHGGSKGYKHGKEDAPAGARGERDWDSGVDAFERIQLDISICRLDAGDETMDGITLLEREENDVLLDVPAASFMEGERVRLDILMGKGLQRTGLEVLGAVLRKEGGDDPERAILKVAVAEPSRPHLGQIQKVFEDRQEELLMFLRDAKGHG